MRLFASLLFRNRLAAAGALVLGVIAILAILTPILPLQSPVATHMADRYQGPLSAGHWLGADGLGRDLLSRLMWGTRLSLAVGIVGGGGGGRASARRWASSRAISADGPTISSCGSSIC